MLRSLLSTWYTCAQQLGAVDVSIKILVEMLGHGASRCWIELSITDHFILMWLETKEDEEPGKLVDELLTVLRVSVKYFTLTSLLIDV